MIAESAGGDAYEIGGTVYNKIPLASESDDEIYQSAGGGYMLANKKTGMMRVDFPQSISVCYSGSRAPDAKEIFEPETYDCPDFVIKRVGGGYMLDYKNSPGHEKEFYRNWGETADGRFYYIAPHRIETDKHRVYIDGQAAAYAAEGDEFRCDLMK